MLFAWSHFRGSLSDDAASPLFVGRDRVRLHSHAMPRTLRVFGDFGRLNLPRFSSLRTSPAHIRSARNEGEIFSHKGPYATSGNWWDEKSWVRAEWDLQLESGDLVRVHEAEGTWKVDGIYD